MKTTLHLMVVSVALLGGTLFANAQKPPLKAWQAGKRQGRLLGAADTQVTRERYNGKPSIEFRNTTNGTRRLLRVSDDSERIEIDTNARDGKNYYHGFEGNQERVERSFTVGKSSKYRALGFRTGDKMRIVERRTDGVTTEKTATATRGREAAHEVDLLKQKTSP